MSATGPSRRDFLSKSGTAVGGAWLFGLEPAIEAAREHALVAFAARLPWDTFTDREGADFEAFSGRIIPTDESPGAIEAGCVYFADRALGTFMADLLPAVRDALTRLEELAGNVAPGGRHFADLNLSQQDALITRLEQEPTPAFFMAKTVVMVGFVGNPEYGGNRDLVGWATLDFEPRFAYSPPFGFYDRNEHGAPGIPDPAPPDHAPHVGGDE